MSGISTTFVSGSTPTGTTLASTPILSIMTLIGSLTAVVTVVVVTPPIALVVPDWAAVLAVPVVDGVIDPSVRTRGTPFGRSAMNNTNPTAELALKTATRTRRRRFIWNGPRRGLGTRTEIRLPSPRGDDNRRLRTGPGERHA